MLAGVVIRLTSTMSSSHSIPSAAAWSCVVTSRVAVGVVVAVAGGDDRAAVGISFMPHSGQLPCSSLTTSGCIGHV